VLAVVALVHNMEPGPWVTGGLCAIGCYVLAAGAFRADAADVADGA
jgi:hypothetical protein